jgi:hypothetical protein
MPLSARLAVETAGFRWTTTALLQLASPTHGPYLLATVPSTSINENASETLGYSCPSTSTYG